jgi:hypothetical protein
MNLMKYSKGWRSFRVSFYFINFLPASLLYIYILLSYFFKSLVLDPLNRLLCYLPS